MKRLVAIVGAATFLVTSLNGCSDEASNADTGTDGYCDTIDDARGEFESVLSDEQTSVRDLEDAAVRFDDIVGVAPDRIAGDWRKLAHAYGDMVTAFEIAGVDTSEPLQEAAGELRRRRQLRLAKALRMATRGVGKSQRRIVRHVENRCDIDIEQSAS